MLFEFGDTVLVRFPYSDQSGFKQRPAVIVSNRAYNKASPDVIVMAITSRAHASLDFGGFALAEWQLAGLLKPSGIKPVFATFEQSLIIRNLGALTPADQAALRSTISTIIG